MKDKPDEHDEVVEPTEEEPEDTTDSGEEASSEEEQTADKGEEKEEAEAEDKDDSAGDKPDNAKEKKHKSADQRWYKRFVKNKKLFIPSVIVFILIVIGLIPQTRYPILGLFWKQTYPVQVLDSQTNLPVTAVSLSIGGHTATTDNHGNALLKVSVGYHTLDVTKKYYTTLDNKVVVPLHVKGTNTFHLVATGRQVPVTVINKITGKPIEDAVVKAADTETHTDSKGQAIIVLPANHPSESAQVTASGYNTASAAVVITTAVSKQNTFSITPSGKIYFLSKLSGKIDVVKTNLDGTDRQTVYAGTGFENDRGTVLLASRDWKYLVLDSVRNSDGNPELNLIDTTNNDKISNVDKGDAQFTSVGWQGDNFIYVVERNSVKSWQPNAESIKSYNAQNGQLTVLDNTNGSGTNINDSVYDTFSTSQIYLFGGKVVYTAEWFHSGGYSSTPGHQNTLNSISPDGLNKTTVASVDAASNYFGNIVQDKGNVLLVEVDTSTGGGTATHYNYNSNGTYTQDNDSDAATEFEQTYPTYLLSPSGNQTFWSEQADGKNNLFTGDANGENQKQIASLSPNSAYGWYTDNYILVSQNSSELYIMPATGGTALKITDYHKPAVNFNGYGGGYGGL